MKIFISWSGKRSKAVAVAVKRWLPYVFPDISPWMSSEDIGAGVRWGTAIINELDSSNFGILCLTPENLNAPWILFEAGAISKLLERSCVAPYCFRLAISDIEEPLAQFQGVNADETGTRELIRSINSRRQPGFTEEHLERVFQKWWPDLKSELSKISEDVTELTFTPPGIANSELFTRFHQAELTILNKRIAQLKDGYLQIFSKEVERIETDLFDYMMEGGLKNVLCVDLTTDPAILLTRTLRAKSREAFISKGGNIKRVLIIDDTKITGGRYLYNLSQVIENEQKIGVQLGLRCLSTIKGELGQDFILYEGFGAIIEGRQADPNYKLGFSIVYFKQSSLAQYESIFKSLWNGVGFKSPAPQLLETFKDFIQTYPRKNRSIDLNHSKFKKEFLERFT